MQKSSDEEEEESAGEDQEDDAKEEKHEEEESVTMQTQNVTELAKNGSFLMEDNVDINFMQECKVKDDEKGAIQKMFEDKNYDIIIGPCSKNTKKPSAGVGCAFKKGKAEVITPKHLTNGLPKQQYDQPKLLCLYNIHQS